MLRKQTVLELKTRDKKIMYYERDIVLKAYPFFCINCIIV